MEVQSQIKRTLSSASALAWIVDQLEPGDVPHRTALAQRVCARYAFRDGRGRAQVSGCLRALRELEAAGHLTLPKACTTPGVGGVRRLDAPVPPAYEVPARAGDVQELRVVRVAGDAQMRIWNELMLREHPQGAGPLVGAQLRYLIGSAHGWLGGFGFAAAALQLRDRDAWIGWEAGTRRAQLHRVIAMSRFLLREAGCQNLASLVLARVLGRVAEDCEALHGYRPWLVESFVDVEAFEGTCYRAANWIQVGHTCGRGRQDRAHAAPKRVKAIYLYPLVRDWRTRLGLAPAPVPEPLAVGAGLDGAAWVEQEFGGASLGDQRLSRRLVESARLQAAQPGRAFTGVAKGDWPATKGYYRLIDQPPEAAVTLEAILAPHQARTRQRCGGEARVLCIQDGTTLDYSGLQQCTGLGVTGSNQTGAQSRGLHLHTTLAISSTGIPLGIVEANCRAPEPAAEKTTPQTPIEDKKSFDWVRGLRACVALAADLPHTRITSVMDREADFFELFDEQRRTPTVDVLIRARVDRRLERDPQSTESTELDGQAPKKPAKLFEHLRASKKRGEVKLLVKRLSARAKCSKRQAKAARAKRQAALIVHYEPVTFPATNHPGMAPVRLCAVHAVEKAPPTGAERVEWFLLTSRSIDSLADAEQCLQDYALRWRIEDWHRVLKSGCAIEKLAHQQVERLQRAIAINLVIAWHIMLMTLLGREVPTLPADVMFSALEIDVLQAQAHEDRLPAPSNLGEAIRLVARLGGYLGRARDPPPGHQLMWEGYKFLRAMGVGYALRAKGNKGKKQ